MGLRRQAHQLFVLIATHGMCGIRFTEITKQDCPGPWTPRAYSCHRLCPEELGGRTGAGFDRSCTTVAGGPLDPQSAMGSAVGRACCRTANRPALGTSTQFGRPGAGGIAPLARLGTSSLCADPVRSNRRRGRPLTPTLHHAPGCQSADVGLDIGAGHPGVCNSILGFILAHRCWR